MQPPRQHSRINLAELKAQIVKKLGPEGSAQYFHHLNRFLSLKMNKVDFNKLCLRIVGRENIPLHNQLVRSILENACSAKAPPSANHSKVNGLHAGTPQPLSNGADMPQLSPKKARTGPRDHRRGGDRPSPLGPNGKINYFNPQSNDFNAVLENGDLNDNRKCSDFSAPSCSKDDGKEYSARSPLRAPLGVSLFPLRTGGAQRAPPIGSFNDGVLSDSVALRERMEQIALTQGIEGVSLDSANLLNHGLDSYMKRLISSCIELVGSRSGHELTKSSNNKHHSYMKLVNGVKPGHQNLVHNSAKPLEVQGQRSNCPISLQDFRVAMEMSPRKLGEDWPLLLEKICISAFEE